VLDALGKKEGAEDDRTEGQRYHDALQLACELLLRAQLVPDRAGADTRIHAVIDLARLLGMPGATELQDAWLAAMTGQHGYLAGKDAEVAACDAIIEPAVIGHPDLAVVDTMIDIVLGFLDGTEDGDDASGSARDHEPAGAGQESGTVGQSRDSTNPSPPENPGDAATWTLAGSRDRRAADRARLLSPEAWQALRYAMARLAIQLVSGPDRLAATLRQGLLDAPYNAASIPLDIGVSASIPGAIRRAVQLRARHCEWPGCDKPPAWCDVHHVRHQADGGETSLSNCALLCQFHHDVCIHRWGWRLVLHPTAPPPPTAPRARCCTATARRRATGHRAPRRPDPPPGTTTRQRTARDREPADPGRGPEHG
jgi:hypothetical protein